MESLNTSYWLSKCYCTTASTGSCLHPSGSVQGQVKLDGPVQAPRPWPNIWQNLCLHSSLTITGTVVGATSPYPICRAASGAGRATCRAYCGVAPNWALDATAALTSVACHTRCTCTEPTTIKVYV
jgi:hypothetical protein